MKRQYKTLISVGVALALVFTGGYVVMEKVNEHREEVNTTNKRVLKGAQDAIVDDIANDFSDISEVTFGKHRQEVAGYTGFSVYLNEDKEKIIEYSFTVNSDSSYHLTYHMPKSTHIEPGKSERNKIKVKYNLD